MNLFYPDHDIMTAINQLKAEGHRVSAPAFLHNELKRNHGLCGDANIRIDGKAVRISLVVAVYVEGCDDLEAAEWDKLFS